MNSLRNHSVCALGSKGNSPTPTLSPALWHSRRGSDSNNKSSSLKSASPSLALSVRSRAQVLHIREGRLLPLFDHVQMLCKLSHWRVDYPQAAAKMGRDGWMRVTRHSSSRSRWRNLGPITRRSSASDRLVGDDGASSSGAFDKLLDIVAVVD